MSTKAVTEYTVYPTGYDTNDEEGPIFTVAVTNRGKGWAVCWMGEVLNDSNQWEYEPQPSSRDDDFYNRCRFTQDDALDRAFAVVDEITVNGWTYARHIAKVNARERADA